MFELAVLTDNATGLRNSFVELAKVDSGQLQSTMMDYVDIIDRNSERCAHLGDLAMIEVMLSGTENTKALKLVEGVNAASFEAIQRKIQRSSFMLRLISRSGGESEELKQAAEAVEEFLKKDE